MEKINHRNRRCVFMSEFVAFDAGGRVARGTKVDVVGSRVQADINAGKVW